MELRRLLEKRAYEVWISEISEYLSGVVSKPDERIRMLT